MGDQISDEGFSGLYDTPVENHRRMRVVIIGAGFSGIYLGVRIPQRLRNIDLCIYDKNAGVGGTWYENRYPGCACDVPSHSYQYAFAPNPRWSSLYAPAPEILAYLTGVAERFSVLRFVKLQHLVHKVEWKADIRKWSITVNNLVTGETFFDEADVVVNAKGALNTMRWPDIPGFDSLAIPVMHSAKWDDSVSFEGKRIGIIGGGSSAIQIVPQMQRVKDTKLSCFVRSKTWIAKPFGDSIMGDLGLEEASIPEQLRERLATDPEFLHKFRTIVEKRGNSMHALTIRDSPLQKFVRPIIENLMKQGLAKKPEVLESLLPDFGVGCRRLTPGPGYLKALSADNVDFITTRIKSAYDNGLQLDDGTKVELDVLICATGFYTGLAPPFPIIGVNGQSLENRFAEFPETYLSIATDGFPNFFFMCGPNGAIGTGPLTTILESMGDYIVKCIRKLQRDNIQAMEVQPQRVQDFVAYMDHYFKKTVYTDSCHTWYSRNGRITMIWPGSSLHAMETLRSPRWEDWNYVYRGEEEGGKETNRLGWLGNGWSAPQLDDSQGDITYFVNPEEVDLPSEPFPEKTAGNVRRAYCY